MSSTRKIVIAFAVSALVLQLAGCGQQKPAGGDKKQGTTQDGNADTAKDTTSQPQQDTAQ